MNDKHELSTIKLCIAFALARGATRGKGVLQGELQQRVVQGVARFHAVSCGFGSL